MPLKASNRADRGARRVGVAGGLSAAHFFRAREIATNPGCGGIRRRGAFAFGVRQAEREETPR
jgi:hypothetical protein